MIPVPFNSPLSIAIERLDGHVQTNELGSIDWIDLSFKELDDETLHLLKDDDAKGVLYLSLAGTEVSDSALAFLEWLPNLEELDLFKTKITGTGFDCQKLKKLNKISLRNCSEVTVAGFSRLATIQSIQSLNLNESSIDDSGLAHIATLPNLRELRLDKTIVTDAGLAELSYATQLRHLSIEKANVTAEGIERLEQSLPNINQGLIM